MKDKQLFDKLNYYENILNHFGYENVCGIDEVGRGPLAGCAVVAGVILDKPILGLKDSKKLSKKKIKELNDLIIENCYKYKIIEISVLEIETYGIKVCVVNAMNKIAVELEADFYLVDFEKISQTNSLSMKKGDSKSNSIAAASIIAKYYRDEKLKKLSLKYPEFSFETNVGYGTKKHYEALKKYGYIDKVHRKNFKPISEMSKEYNEIT